MSLDPSEVKKVANLARLSVSESEVAEWTPQLSQILGLVDQLSELDTTGVEPMVHAIEISNVLSADTVGQSLSREDALKNAPSKDDECFRVPAVLG
jgi:aspartyl-tRNA(Asn)/glutamyl-tRNA(Gln) amidotransferase subunit C